MRTRWIWMLLGGLLCGLWGAWGCFSSVSNADKGKACPPCAQQGVPSSLPKQPTGGASKAFWKRWGDGRAELSGYKGVVLRYGAKRQAETVLVYVTEPMDRRTWIKDDMARAPHRVSIFKLNHMLKFRTGLYPYSVMTSVFTTVEPWDRGQFAPVKIALSAQEWCGHVYHALWPWRGGFKSKILSYFASEGEKAKTHKTKAGTLYEDALWIRLRELDRPFAGGKGWKGDLVPMIWTVRKAHQPIRPMPATISRADAVLDGKKVTRFTLRFGGFWRTFDVEKAPSRRILRWQTSQGESLRLQKTARLPYWRLHNVGDERYRKRLGL